MPQPARQVADVREPLRLPYDGVWPRLDGLAACGAGASVLGKVEAGAELSMARAATLRGDGHFIRVGRRFRIGELSTVHISEGRYPTIVGDRTSVGRDAVLHACTVGSDCVIGDGAVILDGSVVEDGVLVEAGSVVFPRSRLEAGLVYAGAPARAVRPIGGEELQRREAELHRALNASALAPDPAPATGADLRSGAGVFVAPNARLSGRIRLGDRSSVFFACALEAGEGTVSVGDRTNIQDASRLSAAEGDVLIGANTTVGHNVRISASRIGERCLIGTGADLATGTVVENEVLVAAGAATTRGQRLEGGWIWGGRPARPIAPFGEARQAMVRKGVDQYCVYAASYLRFAVPDSGGL